MVMATTEKEKLLQTLPQIGCLEWISVRPHKGATPVFLQEVRVQTENGLEGDHYRGSSGKRQVTLIQAEHLEVVARILGKESVSPLLTRRNLVVSGINLLAFAQPEGMEGKRQFSIGEEVILEMTGTCPPCHQMEENLGPGGYNAMLGHGGITARVIRGGIIRKGDAVKLVQS